MNIAHSMVDLIGHTPLVRLSNIEEAFSLSAQLIAKIESSNPAGSAKDRIANAMLIEAEAKGLLKKGDTLIEATSGNTGIGLAAVAAARGYRVILTMPDTMSIERRNLLKAYGAELVLTEGKLGVGGAVGKAKELAASIPGAFMPLQFENPVNPSIHETTTGVEIWEDTDGQVDIFIAGVGTGGTVTGVSAALKFRNPQVQVIAVEPAKSPMLSQGKKGAHGLQGIGAGFIPDTLNQNAYDEIITVEDEDAYAIGRLLAQKEGLLVGITSGAAVHAAIQIAKRPENTGKMIVIFLPDRGERYLSSKMFND